MFSTLLHVAEYGLLPSTAEYSADAECNRRIRFDGMYYIASGMLNPRLMQKATAIAAIHSAAERPDVAAFRARLLACVDPITGSASG